MIETRMQFRSFADAATAMQALAAAGVEVALGGPSAPVVAHAAPPAEPHWSEGAPDDVGNVPQIDGDQEDDGKGGKRKRRSKVEIAAERHGVTVAEINAAAGGECQPAKADEIAAQVAAAKAANGSGPAADRMPAAPADAFDPFGAEPPAAAPAKVERTPDEAAAFYLAEIAPLGKNYMLDFGTNPMREVCETLGLTNMKLVGAERYDALLAMLQDLMDLPVDRHKARVERFKAETGFTGVAT